MSCAVTSVNRSLIMLAVIWVLIPVAALHASPNTGTETEHARVTSSPSENEPPQCRPGKPLGALPLLRLAISEPEVLDRRPQAR